MGSVIQTIIEQYGILGVLIALLGLVVYLIWGDRKNNWGSKIDRMCDKVDSVESKIVTVENKLSTRMDSFEDKLANLHSEGRANDRIEAKHQTLSIMKNHWGGKISKTLRYFCDRINADHVFMGSFHNGTTDLRGLHYCKFDILIDEFKDPLHLHENDTDFQPLYKDVNIMAYGELPYKMTHLGATVFNVDETLLELSDTLYRRCKSRDIKSIAFVCVRDCEDCPVGFIGCVNYDGREMNTVELDACAKAIENIYMTNE